MAMGLPANRRPSHHRRRQAIYWRRRLLVLLILAGLVLLSWGAVRLVQSNLRQIETSPGFKVESHLQVTDDLRIAISEPSPTGYRTLALIKGSGSEAEILGANVAVKADLKLTLRKDLGAIPVLWVDQSLKVDAPPSKVTIPGGEATEVHGGEPSPLAWLIMSTGLMEVPKPASLLAPLPPPHPTGIVVDLDWNTLYYYEEGQLRLTVPVSTGKFRQAPAISAANYIENHMTPRGEFKVDLLQAEGMAIPSQDLPAGHPLNPYGSRWIGFSVLAGDHSSVWGIHGTTNPELIGRWTTNGTIALRNEDVEALFQRVKEGMPIVIRGGLQ